MGGFTHHPDKEGTERKSARPRYQDCPSASHTIPIKRELKDSLKGMVHTMPFASHTIPIKRELKDKRGWRRYATTPRFTHHPDKEGTERLGGSPRSDPFLNASHTIPIKRELKGYQSGMATGPFGASHTIPIKRELKGTFGSHDGTAGCSFTHHPDKEGTESQMVYHPCPICTTASHTIPIKRELKDTNT